MTLGYRVVVYTAQIRYNHKDGKKKKKNKRQFFFYFGGF